MDSQRLGDRRPSVALLGPDGDAWDRWLESAQCDVFHTADFHRYAGARHGDPYLVVVGDRRRGFAWPYLLRPVVAAVASAHEMADVTSVYGYPGPVAWGCKPGDPFLTQAWAEIVDVWRRQRVVSVFTRFHPLLGNAALLSGASAPAGIGGPGVVEAGTTISIDLSAGVDAARAAYAPDLRVRIASMRRKGVTTEASSDWSELPTFARLYRETMIRNGAAEFYFFDEADFRRLRAEVGDHVHLLVVRHRGNVIAAALFTDFNGIAQWYLAGSDSAANALSPTKVLIDDAVTWAGGRGNQVLHLGGGRGSRNDSLFWFKSRFSPRRHAFHTGRWIVDGPAYRVLSEARLAALRDDETVDGGYFPAYRAPTIAGPDRPRAI